jgi:hypothetical protein
MASLAGPLVDGPQETIRDWLRVNHGRTAAEHPPGIPAPTAGIYEQRNVLGSVTGVQVSMAKGETLPAAPRGFTWSLVQAPRDAGCAEQRPEGPAPPM